MDNQFKFGDKVIDDVYGEGIVVVSKKSFCRVYFKGSGNVRFDMSEIGDLKPVSDWIDVNEKTPPVRYEHDNSYISQSVMVTDSEYHGYYTGFGHINDNGEWVIYRADVDFMNPQKVTHWQPIPQLPR